jgi:hypothetical protein
LGACLALDVLQLIIKAPVIQGDEVPRRMSYRTRQPSPRLQEYVTYIVKHPVFKVLSYDKLSQITEHSSPPSLKNCVAAGYDRRTMCTC